METQEHTWTTAAPESKTQKFSELTDQHLSNILWFNEIFNGWTRYNSHIQFSLRLEWHMRCNKKSGKELLDGEVKRLPWKPLPVLNEIQELKRMGMIHVSGSIIKSSDIYSGNPNIETIGSITHIEGWETL